MAKSPATGPSITINPMFKLLLWINAALCVVSLAVMVWTAYAFADPAPKTADRLFNACEHVFMLTVGGTGWRPGPASIASSAGPGLQPVLPLLVYNLAPPALLPLAEYQLGERLSRAC